MTTACLLFLLLVIGYKLLVVWVILASVCVWDFYK